MITRISFIVGGLNTGGAEKQFLYLLKALASHGIESQVLLLNPTNKYETQIKELGIPIDLVERSGSVLRLARIISRVKKFKPDLIQASHFYCGIYAGLAGHFLQIPSVGAVRGDFVHDITGMGVLGGLAARLPTFLLANSNNARQNAIKYGIQANRIFVLPNVIDLIEFDHQAAQPGRAYLSGNHLKIITVARLIKVKKLELFINSITMAKEHIPGLQAYIAGSGPEDQPLQEYALSIGLSNGLPDSPVVFLGNVENVPGLLSQSDIFLLTSEREGFPNAVLESMAARLPVISTPAGEVAEILDDSNGFLVPHDDPHSISNKIIQLSQEPSLRRRMGLAARQAVENLYSYSSLETNVMNLYQEIISQVHSQTVKQRNQIQEKSKQA